MKRKILIPTKLDKVARNILEANGNYEVAQDDATPLVELAKKHSDAYAMIVRSEKVSAEVIDSLSQLKLIVRAGAGYNTIDTKHARKKGVDVMTTPGANSNGVAEEVIALMLADARQLVEADISARAGKWEKKRFMGRELAHKTVGIVGLGHIGQLAAKRLSGFEVKLLGFDPVISTQRAEEINIELTDLETVFSRSDYITLHIPENQETRGLVGTRLLSLMKNGATLINTARAGVVNEAELREVKKTKKIRFLNDVYPKDEEGPKSVADVADLMAPHLGATTVELNFNAAKRAAEEIIEFDEKGVTSFIVNRAIPEGLDEKYCELANTISRLCRCLTGKKSTLKMLETKIYGSLKTYSEWLLVPVVAGISEEFDRSSDVGAARKYLQEMGIEYKNSEGSDAKNFGNAITIDMSAQIASGSLRNVSIRGTITEGVLMVSRIDEFRKLYFEPKGPTAFFLYDNPQGVLGSIGVKLAGKGINIEDVRNPHDPKTNRSLAIMKVNQAIPDELMNEIGREIRAISAFHIVL